MISDQDFVNSLRAVVIHLIKHDRPLYQKILPIVEAYDDGRWRKMSDAEKLELVTNLDSLKDSLEKYYQEYPHEWSKAKYAAFSENLETYHSDLKSRV